MAVAGNPVAVGGGNVPSLPGPGPTRGPSAGHEMRLPDTPELVHSSRFPGTPGGTGDLQGQKALFPGAAPAKLLCRPLGASWPRRRNRPVL